MKANITVKDRARMKEGENAFKLKVRVRMKVRRWLRVALHYT